MTTKGIFRHLYEIFREEIARYNDITKKSATFSDTTSNTLQNNLGTSIQHTSFIETRPIIIDCRNNFDETLEFPDEIIYVDLSIGPTPSKVIRLSSPLQDISNLEKTERKPRTKINDESFIKINNESFSNVDSNSIKDGLFAEIKNSYSQSSYSFSL